MSDILQTAVELGLAAAATGGGIGIGIGALRAAWRAGGQFGADIDHRTAALRAQVDIERARADAEAAKAAALASLQPRSWSYAPHHTATHTQPAPGAPPPTVVESEGGELPGIVDLADLGFRPTTQGILLGLAPGGTPITVSARHLMHTGLIGATGGGKSNTGRLILSQLLHCGVDVVLADPHFTPYDADSGDDWRPIASRLKIAPARKASEIDDLFRWLTDELARRFDLRSAGERVGTPIVAYVDELPAIVADVPGAMDALGKLLREGRKVWVYLISASQDLLVKTLKTGGEIRENLRSCYYSGGAVDSAVPLLDMSKKDIAQFERQLGQGVVLLRSHATPQATLARVPYASNHALAGLLPDDIHSQAETLETATPWQSDGKAVATERTAEEQRILDMFCAGASMAEIAREISGAKNGRRYAEASERVQAVVRAAVG